MRRTVACDEAGKSPVFKGKLLLNLHHMRALQ